MGSWWERSDGFGVILGFEWDFFFWLWITTNSGWVHNIYRHKEVRYLCN